MIAFVRRTRVAIPLVAIAVALTMVLSYGAIIAPSTPGGLATSAGLAAPAPTAAPTHAPSHPVPGSGSPPSSGPGIFWNNTLLNEAPAANKSCNYDGGYGLPGSFCTNDSGSPAIASTPAGYMVTAATSFSNVSSCPGEGSYTQSEIAISLSSNGGSSFGSPTYLSNPGCSASSEYTSAMWPALTTLSNGTFVLAYLEYNATLDSLSVCPYGEAQAYYPSLEPCFMTYDRLVVTDSYNNGVTWTAPTTIVAVNNSALNNTAPIPAQPAIAAFGQTVYLAWTNFTYPDFEDYYFNDAPSIGLQLESSTGGGANGTWSAATHLPVIRGSGSYSNTLPWVDYAPALAVNATGEFFVTYDTNFTKQTASFCQPTGCGFLDYGPEATVDVVVALSGNNGSTFHLHTVASEIPVYYNGYSTWISGGPGSFISPQPAIAINPVTEKLFITFAGGAIGTYCSTTGSCYSGIEDFENLWVSSSTNGGKAWASPFAIGDTLLGINGTANGGEYLFTPSIGVGTGGNVFINAAYVNDGVCSSYYCGQWSDALFESTNNGSTFANVFFPYGANADLFPYPFWDGMDSSMTIYQGAPYAAWTWFACPANATIAYVCEDLSNIGYTQVVVTSLAIGTGVTVSFNATGLPLGYNWSISLSGNERAGPSTTTLSVSGVPIGRNETWTIGAVNTKTYGIEFSGVATTPSPGSFLANATINVSFTESALLSVHTVPQASNGYPFYCGGTGSTTGDYCGNELVTPGTGSSWVPVGSPLAYSVLDGGLPTLFCYSCFNYTFVSWSGNGPGSWNSTVANGTAIINGPANETASFAVANICYDLPYYACVDLTYSYNFTEVGLPSGTTWTATLGNVTNTSARSYLTFWGPAGPVPYIIDTIPYNASYSYVGTSDVPSPITSTQGDITITFALVPDSSVAFAANFTEVGAPPSASGWGLVLGSTTLGLPLSGETLRLQGGGTGIALNATPVYGNAGVEGTISNFEVSPDIVGASNFSVAPGGSLILNGPATVTAVYSPNYWLDVPTPAGGTVNGSSQWVRSGAPVTLTATANTGYTFVGWSGSGLGSRSGTTLSITVNPLSPVTEVATFAPVTPTYTVTVEASGLPAGTDITFALGTASYTGPSPLAISGVAPGTYAITAPAVAVNGTAGEQFQVSSLTSSLPLAAGQLTVGSDGTVSIGYSAQYLLTMNPTVNGTVSPVAGSYWEGAGSVVTVTATPTTGYIFLGWVGTGAGSYSGTNLSTTVTPTGPISETATFAFYVAPVYYYSLVLTPTGLPTGTMWSASIGSTAVTGTGPLTFTLVNGSYTVTVGTVSPSSGVEYVPNPASFPVSVAGPTPYAGPTFTAMYLVTVLSSTGGTAGPASGWEAAGASVTLTAVAASGYTFVNWSGSGTGSYTGTTPSSAVTVSGPVQEFATFVPTSSLTKSSGGGGGSDLPAIGLLIALLVVGLVVGLLIARSRPPSGGRGAETYESSTTTTEPTAPAETGSTEGSEIPPPPSGGTEEDSIYGGGSG